MRLNKKSFFNKLISLFSLEKHLLPKNKVLGPRCMHQITYNDNNNQIPFTSFASDILSHFLFSFTFCPNEQNVFFTNLLTLAQSIYQSIYLSRSFIYSFIHFIYLSIYLSRSFNLSIYLSALKELLLFNNNDFLTQISNSYSKTEICEQFFAFKNQIIIIICKE